MLGKGGRSILMGTANKRNWRAVVQSMLVKMLRFQQRDCNSAGAARQICKNMVWHNSPGRILLGDVLDSPLPGGTCQSYPAQQGLTWRNLPRLPSPTRINSFLCQSSVICTLIYLWSCRINCSHYSYVKKQKNVNKNRKDTNEDL